MVTWYHAGALHGYPAVSSDSARSKNTPFGTAVSTDAYYIYSTRGVHNVLHALHNTRYAPLGCVVLRAASSYTHSVPSCAQCVTIAKFLTRK